MDETKKVIDWFLQTGGRYGNNGFLDRFGGNDYREIIRHTELHEIHYRRLQIFVVSLPNSGKKTELEVQYLLDHSRAAGEMRSIDDTIKNLGPMLPEKTRFEIGSSVGVDIFLVRVLSGKDLEPRNLDQILLTLTNFALLAVKHISILYTAPKFERVLSRFV